MYRDRAGCAIVTGQASPPVDLAKSHLMAAARANYSMPPNHSAAVVCGVLNDPLLRQQWESEIKDARSSLHLSRQLLAGALAARAGSQAFDYILQQKGLFSLLHLTGDQVMRLRIEHGIFMVGNSRINLAGIGEDEAVRIADAVAD